MGKQINFYMSDIVQERFSDYLEQNGFIFLDNNSKVICNPTSKDVFGMYLYKKNYGKIVMNQYNNGIMDSISSPVIQYSKTVTKEEEKTVLRGRIWISEQYSDESGLVIKKSVDFIKDYKMLVSWIKKNVPYQEIRKAEFYVKEYVNDEVKSMQEKGYILSL